MRRLKIITVKSGIGAGTPGASLGIGALRVAGLSARSSFFSRHPFTDIENRDEMRALNTPYTHARFVNNIIDVERRVCEAVHETLSAAQTPLLLTGDHSSAYGIMAGIKKTYPQKRLGVVWIDAHADLHTPYTSPYGNVHGMPLALAAQLDNASHGINEPDEETLDYWKRLQEIGSPEPKILLNDVVYIALRSMEKQERALVKQYGMRQITVEAVRTQGAGACVQMALDTLRHCDLIYVSFDVDSICASLSRGTGTPVANGLTFEEASALSQELAKAPNLCAWEVTEINPLLDTENKMANRVFPIVEKVAATLAESADPAPAVSQL